MSHPTLEQQRALWQKKPSLRLVYEDLYRRMTSSCISGRSLEIGGGSGNLKSCLPRVISTDIVPLPWIDVAADAQNLPFASGIFANILLFDVFHHLQWPILFLAEAERLLAPGGRLILVEPAMTPVARFFYNHFHPEPVDMTADPLVRGHIDPDRDPFTANQALAHLLFLDSPHRLSAHFPELELVACHFLSLFSYPLSGGFRPWSLLPAALVPSILSMEEWLLPILGPWMAFRLMVVVEKRRSPLQGNHAL